MNGRRRFVIAALTMTLVFVVSAAVFLRGQEPYEPPAPAAGVDVQRSQVYVTGSGYEVDKKREKTHKGEEKKKEEQQAKKPKKPENTRSQTPAKAASAKTVRDTRSVGSPKSPGPSKSSKPKGPSKKSGPGTPAKKPKKPGPGSPKTPVKGSSEDTPEADDPDDPAGPSGGGGDGPSEEEQAKKPVIRISIASGERISGQRVDFTVRVTDYKGRNVPVFSEDDGSFSTVFNGEQLVSAGVSGNETAFRVALAHGDNEIYVSAVDREGNTGARSVRFTGDTSADAEVIGRVDVSVQAPILHLGTIAAAAVDIHSGDTAKDVLDETFAMAGITPYYDGSYLRGIGRESIAAGAWIDDDTRAVMEDLGKTEKDPDKQDRNRLVEHDFYDSSGWIYFVNGEFYEGTSLSSCKVEDGDEVLLIFQLATDVY